VPPRIRYALSIEASPLKRIAETPPPFGAGASQFETRIQPPSPVS
jgi:hypothetical protein